MSVRMSVVNVNYIMSMDIELFAEFLFLKLNTYPTNVLLF